jgi:hypothetical protein
MVRSDGLGAITALGAHREGQPVEDHATYVNDGWLVFQASEGGEVRAIAEERRYGSNGVRASTASLNLSISEAVALRRRLDREIKSAIRRNRLDTSL